MLLGTWWYTSRPRPGTCSDGDGASCGKPVSGVWQGNILQPGEALCEVKWFPRSSASIFLRTEKWHRLQRLWPFFVMMVRVTRLTKQFSRPVNVWGGNFVQYNSFRPKKWHLLNTDLDHDDVSDDLKQNDDDFDLLHPGTGLYDDDGNDVLEHDDDDDNNDRPHLGTGLAHLRQTPGYLRPGHLPPKYGSEQSWWRWCEDRVSGVICLENLSRVLSKT